MIPTGPREVLQYVKPSGRCVFADWFGGLDVRAALKVRTGIARLEAGNFGDVKRLAHGVWERRVDWGPGYRIYFGLDGDRVVILLAGGTKRRQQADIDSAEADWAEYLMLKRKL